MKIFKSDLKKIIKEILTEESASDEAKRKDFIM